jgi:hypothetical protein
MKVLNGPNLKNNNIVAMGFMLNAFLKCIEYLWVHSIAESGFKKKWAAMGWCMFLYLVGHGK